jgi:hypothetical protein
MAPVPGALADESSATTSEDPPVTRSLLSVYLRGRKVKRFRLRLAWPILRAGRGLADRQEGVQGPRRQPVPAT